MMNFEGKTILVTGATGLIGSNLVNKLLESGSVRVIALGRSKEKLETVFNEQGNNKNLILLEHDISNPLEINEYVDVVFHAAGPIAGSVIKETPVDVILPNIVGTFNILDFIEKQRNDRRICAKMVIFSSATVYANVQNKDVVVKEESTAIADTLDAPNAPYSESKRMVEVIAKAYAKQKNLNVSIVRFSYVYGHTKYLPNTAFYEFVKKALTGENIVLNNAGLPRRDNIYIDDAVEGLLTVALRGQNGESYNISTNTMGNNFAAVDEMAAIIAATVNKKKHTNVKVEYKNPRIDKSRLPGIILSNDKLCALGWQVNTSLEEGIRKTIDMFG